MSMIAETPAAGLAGTVLMALVFFSDRSRRYGEANRTDGR
jgi:hypothetical protein